MTEHGMLFSAPVVRALLEGSKTQTRRPMKPQPFADVIFDDTTGEWGQFWWSADFKGYPTVENWKDLKCPYGQIGDRIWVRETWRFGAWRDDGRFAIDYASSPEITNTPWVRNNNDDSGDEADSWLERIDSELTSKGVLSDENGIYHWESGQSPLKWHPSIHMPRWASRITLEITDVRVQRLQEISEEDSEAEGIDKYHRRDCRTFSPIYNADGVFTEPGDCSCSGHSLEEIYEDLWNSIYGLREGGRKTHNKAHLAALKDYSWDANPWVWALTFKVLPEHIPVRS